MKITIVAIVDVYLTANTLAVVEWLKSKGVNPCKRTYEYEDGSGGGGFTALVPLSLLGELADSRRNLEKSTRPGHKPSYVDKE